MKGAGSTRIRSIAGFALLTLACGGGGGGQSATVSAAPSGLAAAPRSSTAVSLTWEDNSADETGFVLERKVGAGGTFAVLASLPANATSHADQALTPSTTYFYRLRAQNAAGASAYSAEASATTFAAGSPPAVPSGLAAVASSPTTVSLTWQDQSADETGFVVERKVGAGGTFTPLASLPANTASHTDRSLTPSTTYVYRLRAQNASGYSGYSAEAFATTLAAGSPTVWARSYAGPGNTRVNALQPTSDGGFVVAGSMRLGTSATSNQAAWAMKIAADGTIAWQKTFGGSLTGDAFQAVRQTADHGYVLAGGIYTTASDAWVVRVDADGAILWQKRYGTSGPNQWANDVYQTDDGGFVVAGYAERPGSMSWVFKLAADGTLEWEHNHDTASPISAATAVRQTADLGYIVTGYRFQPAASPSRSDFFVLQLQQNGTPSSLTTFPLADRSWAQAAALTSDGGLVVAGYTDIDATAAINDEAWLLKLAADGSVDWQKTYGDGPGGSFVEHAFDVREKPGGGYLVAGTVTGYGASSNDFWLLEVDAAGAATSQRRYGGLGGDTATAAAMTPSGGCIVAGTTTGFSGTDHGMAWLVSLDATRAMTFDPLSNVTLATTSAQAVSTAATPTAVSSSTDGLGILAGTDTTVVAVDTSVTVRTQSQ